MVRFVMRLQTICVAYSSSGTLTGTFYAQISDASGNFTDGVFSGATIIGSGASSIAATIPSGIAAGTGYKVRVINDNPATYGSDNGTAFSIFSAAPTINTPPANQTTNVGSPATFTVSATNATSYQWFEDPNTGTFGSALTTGGIYNVSGNTLTVTPGSVALNNYKYKVNAINVCGTTTSTPSTGAVMTVNNAPVAIYQHNFGTTTISAHPYTVNPTATPTPGIFATNLSNSSWTSSNGAFTSFGGSSGQALVIQPTNGSTSSMTLTFDVASGYACSITSFDYWRQRSTSGPTTVNSITINGITVATNLTNPTTGALLGQTNVSNAVNNLTGTITVVINLSAPSSGSQNFRLDDFTLLGNITPLVCTGTPASIALTPASPPALCAGYTSSGITLGLTGTIPTNSTYQWQRATTSGGTYTNISGATSATYVIPTGLSGSGNWYQCVVSCGGNDATSDEKQIVVNALPAQPSVISGPTSPCASSTGNVFSVNNVSGVTYTWAVSGTGWSIPSPSSLSSVTVTAGTSNGGITVTPTENGCVGTARTLTGITPASSYVPSVSIVNNASGLCTSNANILTATRTDGNGGTASYEWFVNGSSASTANPYNAPANTFNNGDQIYCVMTVSGSCASPTTAKSNLLSAQIFAHNKTTAWTETFGTGTASSSPTVVTYTGYTNGQGFTFGQSPAGYPEIRTSSPSPTGSGASGGSNLYFATIGTAGAPVVYTINGINTTNAYPNTLSFWVYNDGSAISNTSAFKIEFSTDGANYFPLTYGPTSSTLGWYFLSIEKALPLATNVRLRFTQSASIQARIDDLKLEKYSTTPASITPSVTPTFCNLGTVQLTAAPTATPALTYAWSSSPSSPSFLSSTTVSDPTATNVTATRTYTVAITDAFTCSSTASQAVTINPEATVQLGASTPIYTEAFASGLPAGWSINTPSGAQYDWGAVTSTSSSGYTGASGSNNFVVANSATGANATTVSQLISSAFDVSEYSNISVIWGARKTASYPSNGALYYSINGSTWTEVVFTDVAANGTWALVNGGVPVRIPDLGAATTLYLRWDGRAVTDLSNYRIDDIQIFGLKDIVECASIGTVSVPYASSANATTYSLSAGSPALPSFVTQAGTLAAGGGTLSVVIPNGSADGDYNFTLSINGLNGCNATYTIPLTLNCDYTWTGATSSAWTTPTNWTPNGIPNDCAHNVTIPNGLTTYPTIGLATFTVGNFTIEEGATLTINGGSIGGLKVCGDVTAGATAPANVVGNSNNGLILEGGATQEISGILNIDRLRLNNSAGATLQSGANVSINKAVELQLGTLAINGQTMTFKSTSATSYAILDNFSSGYLGALTGNATAERYVPVAGINQHYIGSPIASTSFAQLGASGTPGYLIPKPDCDQNNVASNSPYGNIFEWHDNITANGTCLYNGWEVKTSGTAQAGKGYSVYLPNGTFSITGALNQNTSYNVGGLDNIGWESNTLQTVGTVPAVYKSGWHIVANPFLAPLQLSGHSANFTSAAVWVTSGPFAGTYQSVAITGGQIAPFQGFIVRRSSTIAPAATFTFDKSECVTTTNIPFYKTASEHALSLQVSGNGFNDITRVEFNSSTTNGFDVDYDAFKPISALGQPTIASFNTDITERLAINVNKNIAETPNVQLNFVPGNNGTFSFTVDGINTFDPTSYITLEDTKEGTMIDLRQHPVYTFTASKTDNHNRFVLHFTPAAEMTTTAATCTEDGTLSVMQDGPADWNYTITNSQAATIATGILNSTSPIHQVVPIEVYTITLTDNSGYQVVKNVQVNGQTSITAASITATATTIEEQQPIDFSTTTTATTVEWNFGDGTTATTATATHEYATPGIYTVTLTIANADGCTATTTQTITVTAKVNTGVATAPKEMISIYPNPASTILHIHLSKVATDTKLTLTNALGQTVRTQDKLKVGVNPLDVSQLAEGIYLLTVNEGKAVLITQRIVISQ